MRPTDPDARPDEEDVDAALAAMRRDPEACPTPAQLVAALDRHIVGQDAAKRAVAVAMRNRWRRSRVEASLRRDIVPKNILMIGPTGVGKTEIARRLARLTGAPFVKVEATKYTEVGYHGRDVESMVRDLVAHAVALVRDRKREAVKAEAARAVEDRILDLLLPRPSKPAFGLGGSSEADKEYKDLREAWRKRLAAGELDDRRVEIQQAKKATPMIMGPPGMENFDVDFGGMLEKFMPKQTVKREVTVREARRVLADEEADRLLDNDAIGAEAVRLAEEVGIIFIDELDKIVAGEARGPDVSRQGVQRDLLPIVEGATVQTRHGAVSTNHVLFIAAGAFHQHKPSELMPELQGRFPIRVELSDLTEGDLVRILREPKNSLIRQYVALMATEGVTVTVTDDAVDAMAEVAHRLNRSAGNIGARRLHTILERVFEDLSFVAAEEATTDVTVDAEYVMTRLRAILGDEDLSGLIL